MKFTGSFSEFCREMDMYGQVSCPYHVRRQYPLQNIIADPMDLIDKVDSYIFDSYLICFVHRVHFDRQRW